MAIPVLCIYQRRNHNALMLLLFKRHSSFICDYSNDGHSGCCFNDIPVPFANDYLVVSGWWCCCFFITFQYLPPPTHTHSIVFVDELFCCYCINDILIFICDNSNEGHSGCCFNNIPVLFAIDDLVISDWWRTQYCICWWLP